MRSVGLAIVSVLLLGGCSNAPPSEPQQAKSAYAAPDFRVTTFEGATFRLEEQAGNPVVLNFWESW